MKTEQIEIKVSDLEFALYHLIEGCAEELGFECPEAPECWEDITFSQFIDYIQQRNVNNQTIIVTKEL